MKRSRVVTPARPEGLGALARLLCAAVGAALLALSVLSSYSSPLLQALGRRVFVQVPGSEPGDYFFFSIHWVVFGLPLALVLVGLTMRRFRAALSRALSEARPVVLLAAILLVLLFSMLPWEPEAENPAYAASRIVFGLTLSGAGLVLFLVGAYRQLGFLARLAQGVYDRVTKLSPAAFLVLTAGFTFVVSNLVSWFVFFHLPQVADSVSQLFQARLFASGRLFLAPPRFPDFFDYTHIISISGQPGQTVQDWPGPLGRWYSQYPFLHPLILTLGVLIKMPWVINPLLGAFGVVAIYFLGREVYDERTGRLGALLACVSPFIFNMSAEFMNHSSALLFATLFMLFWFRATGTGLNHQDTKTQSPEGGKRLAVGGWLSPLLAGACIGLVADIRPYTAAALAVPFALYGLYLTIRQPGRFLPRFGLMVVAALAVASLSLVYNNLTNGHPFLFGYVVKYGPGHEIGFGRSAWGQGHTPLRGLISTGHDLNMLNRFLLEWPIPALAAIGVLLASGVADRRDWLLLAGFAVLPVAYFFYWFHQACFGPRFLYEASGFLLLLTVRGGQSLGQFARRRLGLLTTDKTAAGLLGRLVPLSLIWAALVGLPPLLGSYRAPALANYKPVRNARQAGLTNALVFCHDFGDGFTANSLGLNGDVVFARDFGVVNSALTLAFPSRACYYANRDTLVPLPGLGYQGSRLESVLGRMTAALSDSVLAGYRTLLWPVRELADPRISELSPQTQVMDYRDLSREVFSERHTPDDYLPALACWLIRDEREHLRIFSYMSEHQSYIADKYKFTLLTLDPESTAAYFDIRQVEGNENRQPAR
jgi:hypothetical protein